MHLQARWSGITPQAMLTTLLESERSHVLGDGDVHAEITGAGTALLACVVGSIDRPG